MDSPVALALMAKAQEVFGTEDFFLSFPIVPRAFTKSQLSFIAGGAVTRDSLNGLAEFTRLVNMVPGKPVWLPTGGPYLWDVYGDVLKSAQLAHSTRTAEEEAAYQAAFKYLHILHDDGTWEDTPQVKVYNQYRDALLALQQDYNNRKITSDLSTDPAVKQHWQDVDAPALQAKMEARLNDWATNAYKAQVEDAKSTFARLGAKSPSQIWAQWQSQFNPLIDTLTDTHGQSVFITGFSPSDAIDAPIWQHFTLTGEEVAALLSRAPDELRKRLAPDAIDLDIDMLSFEYTSVFLTRPWLHTGVLDARFWRFNDGVASLSDGQTSPAGRCPAYVVSVVFARNVEVRLKAQSAVNTTALQGLQLVKGLSLGSFALSASPELTASLEQPVLLSYLPLLEAEPVSSIETARPTATVSSTEIETARPIETIRPDGLAATLEIAPPIVLVTDVVDMQQEIERPIVPVTDEISPVLFMQSDRVNAILKGSDYQRIPPIHLEPPPSPQPGPPVVLDDSIYIMTFICKALPLCPNPDFTLKW